MLNFLTKLPRTTWLLVGLMLVAAFLRLWMLSETLQFLGDQGRDAMIVARIFTEADPVFIGPVTSVGNMYLGPFYYYLMMPFLWLSYPSPMGPVYAVALLGILTVWLVYYLGKELVGRQAALWATFFYTFSAPVIIYTRFSWNPNPAPLFSLLMIYSTYKAWKGQLWYWLAATVCFSILIQLHYVTLLTAPAAGIFWLLQAYRSWRSPRFKQLLLVTLTSAAVFLLSTLPLMAFDYKHGWLNLKAFTNMTTSEENFKTAETTTPLMTLTKALKETHGRSLHILYEISIGENRTLNTLLVIATFSLLTYLLWEKDQRPTVTGETVIFVYLAMGVIGLSFYEHSVFDHYIAYLFPVTYLIYGVVSAWLWSKHLLGRVAVLLFAAFFLWHNVPPYNLKEDRWTIHDMQRVTATINERVQPGEKYNIVLLSGTGDIDAQNYRYFLTTTDKPPVETDQRGEVDTLFIIDEERSVEKVTDLPIYDIVTFPNKEPAEVYNVPGGPEVTVLRR